MPTIFTRLLLPAVVILFSTALFSQTITFQKRYGRPDLAEAGFDLLALPDGYLLAGENTDSLTGNTDALLIRTDLNGTVLWQKTYGQFDDDVFNRIAPANDGGFIAWGSVRNANTNRLDAWLVKVDAAGDLVWQQIIGQPGFSEQGNGNIIAMPDGYILSGVQSNPGYSQTFVLRVDENGNTLWSRFTPSSNYNTLQASYVADNKIYLGGTTNGFTCWRTMNPATGDILQTREYAADSTNWLHQMRRTPDGGHLLSGNLLKDIPGLIRINGGIQKLDSTGHALWTKSYKIADNNFINASVVLADGASVHTLSYFPNTNNGPIQNTVLMKVDTAGKVLWARNFGSEHQSVYLVQLRQTADGGFVALGTDGIDNTLTDIALIKTDSLGIIQNCCVANRAITVEEMPATPVVTSGTESAFENTLAFPFAFAAVSDLEAADFCSNIQPVLDQTIVFCPGETVTLGGVVYNQPGTINLVLPSATGGCDTLATYTLEYAAGCSDTFCEATFFKRLFIAGKSTVGHKIVPAPNGNYYYAASVDDQTLIALLTKNMQPLWVRSADMAPGPDLITDMRLDADGQLIGVGNTNSLPVNCFAFKMNAATGQLLWLSNQNSPINSYFTQIHEKYADGSGNYFLIGQTDAISGGSGCDAQLLEIDRNTGAMLWDKHYHLGSCEIFNQIMIENNRIYACGRYNLHGGGQAGFRPALTLLDINGNVLWSRHYLRPATTNARMYASEMVADNGSIVLFGYGNDSGTNLAATTLQLMKTTPDGELLWAKDYDITGASDQLAFNILNFSDGYLLAGTFVRPTSDGKEIFLIKTDKNGNPLWQRAYGNTGEDRFRDLIQDSGKLLLTGGVQNGPVFDMFAGKLHLDGGLDSDIPCSYVKPLSIEVTDYSAPFQEVHTLSPISVAHNYATAPVPGIFTETIAVEAICVKICTDTCDGMNSTLQLNCPPNQLVSVAPGTTAAPVSYDQATASSDCPCPEVTVSLDSGNASGSLFPLGVSTVCFRAGDGCDAEKTCCFTITVEEENVCDSKSTACLKFELLSVNRDAGQQWVYRVRMTNTCASGMTYAYIQVPDGVTAVAPEQNSIYTGAGGQTYTVRNPGFSPFYSIRFKPNGAGLANGQSDVFRYVLPEQVDVDYIHVAARLASGVLYEAHLNTFYCPVGTEPDQKPAPGAARQHRQAIPAVLRVAPNPVAGGARLRLLGDPIADGEFVLQDLTGRIVFESRIQESQLAELPASMPAGIYFFKIIENGQLSGTGKLSVE